MFFPRAELGWHRKIPKKDTREEGIDADDINDDDEPGKFSDIVLSKIKFTYTKHSYIYMQLTFHYLHRFSQWPVGNDERILLL